MTAESREDSTVETPKVEPWMKNAAILTINFLSSIDGACSHTRQKLAKVIERIAEAYASRPEAQADDSQQYTLEDYMNAPSHGPLHATWEDKPHRLIYDLVKRVREAQAAPVKRTASCPNKCDAEELWIEQWTEAAEKGKHPESLP